jgi:hypothetical protein
MPRFVVSAGPDQMVLTKGAGEFAHVREPRDRSAPADGIFQPPAHANPDKYLIYIYILQIVLL